jgi:hypothetical protein
MYTPNLFDRLEGYAHENFTTEALAYILQTDGKVRRKFLELLLDEHKEVLAAFGDYDIITQPSHVVGRPDLEIRSKRDHTKIHVEVKTQSQEGEGQIQKYLKLHGYVAYLTPRDFVDPTLPVESDRFLGHFCWHDVHSVIKGASPNNVIHKQFLEYLEARHMGPLKPITKQELRLAAPAVDFVRKSQELIQCVRKRIERPYWESQFGKNIGGKRIGDDFGGGDLHYWWYRPKHWWKKRRGFYLCIGNGFEEDQGQEPKFYLCIGSAQKPFWRDLDFRLAKQFQKLCDEFGWKKDPDTSEYEWSYRKFFPLGAGEIDKIADQQAKNVRSAVKELQQLRIIRSMENKL